MANRYYWDSMDGYDVDDDVEFAFPYAKHTARIIDTEAGGVVAYVHRANAEAVCSSFEANPIPIEDWECSQCEYGPVNK